MIASLRGQLITKDAQGVVVDCGGVGYGLALSLASLERVGDVGQEVALFVHTHVSQDVLRLYGFVEARERQSFEVLIGLSGVGPRLALAILSTLSPDELRTVVHQRDKVTLTRIPGVGKKTAERLLVELKHRLPDVADSLQTPVARERGLLADLESALVGLGFKPGGAGLVAQQTVADHPEETDLATLVRLALRAATRG